jgi:hypothetical protein
VDGLLLTSIEYISNSHSFAPVQLQADMRLIVRNARQQNLNIQFSKSVPVPFESPTKHDPPTDLKLLPNLTLSISKAAEKSKDSEKSDEAPHSHVPNLSARHKEPSP